MTISWSFAHVMSRCDLDLWPHHRELLRHFDCHVFKLCIKFEQNRIIHGRFIEDLTRLRRAILGGGDFCPTVHRGAWTQLHQTWRVTGWPFLHKKFVSAFGHLDAFSNAGGSYLSDVKNDAKFRTFWPSPVKIRGRVGEISISIVEALPTTLPSEYIWWPSAGWLRSAVYW